MDVTHSLQLVLILLSPFIATWILVEVFCFQKLLLPIKVFFLDKVGFIYPIYILLFLFAVEGLVDWKIYPHIKLINEEETYVLFLTLLAIIAYTVETYRLRDITYIAANETARTNELRLRPYLSLHWDSSYKSGDRRGEQITDTCLLARNDGEGLMRKVSYFIQVNDQEVLVRNHNIITSNRSGTAVVYSSNNTNQLLGDRNDGGKVASNNELISTKIKTARVYGEYEDLNGVRYEYSFARDENEQSWFREEFQRRAAIKT